MKGKKEDEVGNEIEAYREQMTEKGRELEKRTKKGGGEQNEELTRWQNISDKSRETQSLHKKKTFRITEQREKKKGGEDERRK